MQKDDGGSIYLRLTTRPLEQPKRQLTDNLKNDIINGAYWWRAPSSNCELIIVYQGVVADQVFSAAGFLAEAKRDVGVLAVTSADRLHADLNSARRRRSTGEDSAAVSHIEQILINVPRHAMLVTVIDGHPATLSWLGGVYGHQTISHGVEEFGQTGTIMDLYRQHHLDHESIVQASLNSI